MNADDPITLDPPPGPTGWSDRLTVAQPRTCPALTIVWSLTEPQRVGETAIIGDDQPRVLGRGQGDDGSVRVEFMRRRPGRADVGGPLEGPTLSRRHVRVRCLGETLEFDRLGRGPVALDGEVENIGHLTVGRTLLLADELLVLCERRPVEPQPRPDAETLVDFAFGTPDPQGIVGESPAIWTVREQIHFAARASAPLLVTGAPGAGREAVARAVHTIGSATTPLIAIDGSALRAEDLDALAARTDAPTLLVVDIGDVPGELQNHLVRFATRLMTRPPPRTRLIGTTTREAEKVRPTLAARFPLAIRVPDLTDRRGDVPLIARALLHAMAEEQPRIGERFFAGWGERPPSETTPRLTPQLVMRLVQHPWPGQAHELQSLLWRAAMSSNGDSLELTPEVEAVLGAYIGPATPSELGPDVIRHALAQSNGKVTEAARRLGLNSRFQLYRLLDKYDIKPS